MRAASRVKTLDSLVSWGLLSWPASVSYGHLLLNIMRSNLTARHSIIINRNFFIRLTQVNVTDGYGMVLASYCNISASARLQGARN